MATITLSNVTSVSLNEELDQLFREHYQMVYRTAYGVTGSREDSQDVLQTIFLSVPAKNFIWTENTCVEATLSEVDAAICDLGVVTTGGFSVRCMTRRFEGATMQRPAAERKSIWPLVGKLQAARRSYRWCIPPT